MKKSLALTIIAIIALLIVGGFWYLYNNKNTIPEVITDPIATSTTSHQKIGTSVEGRSIDAYTYGTGDKELVFVGGIHGGYEWNSVLLAYEFMDYFKLYEKDIPSNIRVTIIPSANPDGLYKVIGKEGRFALADAPTVADVGTGKGRFNAHNVDLNRNFACKWQATSTWRSKAVNPGTEAFSEPEARAIRDYATLHTPEAFVFLHSQSNAVYASECEQGILPETLAIMKAYSGAAGYKAVDSFDAYPVTGDAEGWLASIGIPAITVELSTHEAIEWEKNLAGVRALFAHYQEEADLAR
jgi:predicted deacylase